MSESKGGPGICVAAAKIIAPSVFSPAELSKWYDEHHIPRLMSTGGFSSVIRAVASDDNSTFPFITIYAMPDVNFANSDTFRNMVGENYPIDQTILPGSGKLFDIVEVDMRIYRRITNTDPDGKLSAEIKSFCLVEGEPEDPLSDAESKEAFEQTFMGFLNTLPTSAHSERYKLEYEWWSSGGSLYNSEQLDFFGFSEEEPDYYGNFEKFLTTPGNRGIDYRFEIKTFSAIQNKQAAEFAAK